MAILSFCLPATQGPVLKWHSKPKATYWPGAEHIHKTRIPKPSHRCLWETEKKKREKQKDWRFTLEFPLNTFLHKFFAFPVSSFHLNLVTFSSGQQGMMWNASEQADSAGFVNPTTCWCHVFWLEIPQWIVTLPVGSHGSLVDWHSSNTPRLNTHLRMVLEEPSALYRSDTCIILAFPFPNTEILFGLRYKD